MSKHTVHIIAAIIWAYLFLNGCSIPNALTHTDEYHGERESMAQYRYKITHTLERSPVYLIGGIGAAIVGLSQWPSGSPTRLSGSSSSSGNSLLALAGLGLGAYSIYTWINLEDEQQPFHGSGEVRYFALDGRPLGYAKLSGDIITFPSKPGVRVLIELTSGERVELNLQGKGI